jgi:four helix bundle protein
MDPARKGYEERLRRFAIDVIRTVERLPRTSANDVITRQLIRAATSVGANCREAGRAESRNDFVHKLGIAEKEIAEAGYWLENRPRARHGGTRQDRTAAR